MQMAEILVLDDVLDAVILMKKILEKQGHSVHIFTEEDEALVYAKTHSLDLAILDIKLKKMSGTQVLAQLKQMKPELRVVMLTGYPTVETVHEAVELGAVDYWVKPLDKLELEAKVMQILACGSGQGESL